ncbi:MAG: MATE family efflux transporter [Clostridia bacterium]|nr:MATE family efflux transporter [Clostridia bacterium]
MKLKELIGDKAFYARTLRIAIPIIIQNTVTNLVNLLDNLMVGSLGTELMSGVAIVNQFMFVFNLAVFGAISAAGIFTAQYNGRGDNEGVRNTMRAKFIICAVIGLLGVGIFTFFGDSLISMFLHEGSEGDLELTLKAGKEYLVYIIIGLIPYAISQVYASTLRETGQTVVPMISSVVAVATNFVFNGLLIFGLFGFPALGVVGAAIATSLSRFAELLILVIWTHTNSKKCPFAVGVFRSFKVPKELAKQIAIKGLPILCNECLWSLSVTMRNQCYSTRGLEVVAAINIAITLQNLLSVSYFALSNSIGIMIGNLLGAGKLDEARDTDKKLLAFTVFAGCCMCLVQVALSPIVPMFYETSDLVRGLATYLIICFGISMPFGALATACYYTIRSGGKVIVTMLFDSVYAWTVVMPVALILTYFTDISIYYLFPIMLMVDNLKLIAGLILVKKGIWIKQLKVE